MKKTLLFIAILFTGILSAQSTITIGDGTSESATRGPLQRSSSSSSSVYSRAVLHYSATELSTTLTSSATISQINFELGSENIITAPSGDATIKIYMRNSTATDVIGDSSWTDAIDGATEVGTYTYNITNNFPGAKGYLNFALSNNFTYTGGALEVFVDWDCSNLVPVNASAPNELFSGNGSLNWRWTSTTHNSSNYRSGGSGAPSTLQASRTKKERVNTQIVYTTGATASVNDIFASKIAIYPNPANQFVTISSSENINKIEVYNLLGKRVIRTSNVNNNLDVSSLSKGIYILKLTSGNSVATKRIVKK